MAIATKRRPLDYEAIKRNWLIDVNEIVDQLEVWFRSHPSQPNVLRVTDKMKESGLGAYEVPALDIQFGGPNDDSISVDPVGRNFPSRGIVQITAWPNLRKVQLRRDDSQRQWLVYTGSNVPLDQEWTEEGIHGLIDDLLVEL